MVSEEPRPDRCGHKVVDKVGIEVHDDDSEEVYSSEDRIELVYLDDIEDDIDGMVHEIDYISIMQYLRQGYEVTRVGLRPEDEDFDEDKEFGEDELEWVEVEDDAPYTTNAKTEVKGYCERYELKDDQWCYVHRGAFKDNNTAKMTHGLKAKRSNYYENLDKDDKILIEKMVDDWIEDAPFDRDNSAKTNEVYRIAVDQIRLWNAQDEFNEGMVKDQIVGTDDEGNPVEMEKENPANLPYDRLDRTTFKKLKDLGCLDDPDTQNAEAIESLPDKFAELSE